MPTLPSQIEDLYRRHHAGVLAYARRLTDRHTAEDVAQEAFLCVLLYGHGARRAIDLPYLLVTARNLIRRAHRRDAATRRHGDYASPSPAEPSIELPEDLRRLIGGLGATGREALVLTSVHGLRARAAGAALGVPDRVVLRRRERALRALRSAVA